MRVRELLDARLDALHREGCDLNHFHCWFCQKHFGRVEWMRAYGDDGWVRGDPSLASAEAPP